MFYCHVKKLHIEQMHSHRRCQLLLKFGLFGSFPLVFDCVSPLVTQQKNGNVSVAICFVTGKAAHLPAAHDTVSPSCVSREARRFAGAISSVHMMLLSSKINEICIFFFQRKKIEQ